jgi:hypothetical protein
MNGSWVYIDAWDWVNKGGMFAWEKISENMQLMRSLTEAANARTAAQSTLRTAFGVTRCFVWDRASGSIPMAGIPATSGYVWRKC